MRSISLYCDLVGSAILSGMEENLAETGVDIGHADVNVEDDIPSDKEIEIIQDTDKRESGKNDDHKNINKELENNSDLN